MQTFVSAGIIFWGGRVVVWAEWDGAVFILAIEGSKKIFLGGADIEEIILLAKMSKFRKISNFGGNSLQGRL